MQSPKATRGKIENFKNQVGDVEAMAELCDEDENDAAMLKEFSRELSSLIEKIEDLEVESFLSEPMDIRPALAFMQGQEGRNPVIGLICLCGCMFVGLRGGVFGRYSGYTTWRRSRDQSMHHAYRWN